LKPGDDPDHLRHMIQDDTSPLSRVVEVAVRPFQATKQETLEVVQSRARQEIVRMESGLFILEIVVGIAPLLGLLGAVTGLVKVFGNIGSGAMSTTDLKGIASGIGEALSTTIVGLAIAIPALVAFSYFSRRVERLAVEMESLLTDLIEKIFHAARQRESYVPDGEQLEEAAP
jgi:biopolymer transport protein ExbB